MNKTPLLGGSVQVKPNQFFQVVSRWRVLLHMVHHISLSMWYVRRFGKLWLKRMLIMITYNIICIHRFYRKVNQTCQYAKGICH